MTERHELHEWQWQLIRDLFPPPKATGRKRRDPRQMLDAIFWILCSGAPWRDLPERYGPWQSAYHWYRIWTNDGTFDCILERLQVRLNAQGLLDLDTWFVDSTTIRASRAAAGAKKGAARLWAAPVVASPQNCTWYVTDWVIPWWHSLRRDSSTRAPSARNCWQTCGCTPAREAADRAAARSWWWRIGVMMRATSEDICAVAVSAA
jgi:transposase